MAEFKLQICNERFSNLVHFWKHFLLSTYMKLSHIMLSYYLLAAA